MSIEVVWGNLDKTYVYIKVVGDWTWEEYQVSVESANELIQSVTHEVCIITHLTDTKAQQLPSGAFSQWRRSLKHTPKNLQLIILVPGRPVIRLFLDTAQRIFDQFITFSFRMAATLTEAEDIVNEIQPSNTQAKQ